MFLFLNFLEFNIMFSKDDAEKKLFDVYYAVGLDIITGKKPTHAIIEIFEEQNENEHFWRVRDDKLIIFMSAKNFEEGTRYISGNFAAEGAFNDKRDKFVKYFYLFCFGFLLESLAIIPLTMFYQFHSTFAGIATCIIGIGVFFIFLLLTLRWKNRAKERLIEIFQKIGYTYSKKEQKKFSGLVGKNVSLFLLFLFAGFMHIISIFYLISSL